MTIQRRVIDFLDQPKLRWILAKAVTAYAKRRTGLNVSVFYEDGAWIRRIGDCYLAESPVFPWTASKIAGWQSGLGDVIEMYRDWWFHQYKPQLGHTIVDIGAGIGDDAMLFSKAVGDQGRVISLEAHPVTFGILEKNCRYNHLRNVSCVHAALMDKEGTVYIDDRADYKTSTVTDKGADTQAKHAVQGGSFDDLCNRMGIEKIDFLKMNIEGAERLAIQGMPKMIERISCLCIACHDFIGHRGDFYRTKALITDFLKAHGFEVTFRDKHPDPWVRDHAYAIRRP